MKEDSVFYRAPSQIYESGGTCASCYLDSDNPESGIVASGVCSEYREPEKRCARLFEAARVLLKDRKADEDEIFPTLQLASATGAPPFRLLHPGVRMVRVVNEVPILQRRALCAYLWKSERPAPSKTNQAVYVTVHPSRRRTTADDIARTYEAVLRQEGLAWDAASGGKVSYCSWGPDPLQFEVFEYDWLAVEGCARRWPSPSIVGAFAGAVLDERGEDLVLCERGVEMSPDNLIPAMVARVLADAVPLRKDGKINRKEVHRLLDAHVMCSVPWKSQLSDAANGGRALWRNVKKVTHMEELYGPGPRSVSQPS